MSFALHSRGHFWLPGETRSHGFTPPDQSSSCDSGRGRNRRPSSLNDARGLREVTPAKLWTMMLDMPVVPHDSCGRKAQDQTDTDNNKESRSSDGSGNNERKGGSRRRRAKSSPCNVRIAYVVQPG